MLTNNRSTYLLLIKYSGKMKSGIYILHLDNDLMTNMVQLLNNN